MPEARLLHGRGQDAVHLSLAVLDGVYEANMVIGTPTWERSQFRAGDATHLKAFLAELLFVVVS